MMRKLKRAEILLPALSAVLVFIAVLQIHILLAAFCFVPVFVVLQKRETKIRTVAISFGTVLSLFSFFWMIPGAQRFTGSGAGYGMAVFLISAIVLTLYWWVLFTIFSYLQKPSHQYKIVVANATAAACVWVLGEALLAQVSVHLPWFLFRSGMALSRDLFAIQPASFFGVHIASFIVVFINYLLADILLSKRYKRLIFPFAAGVLYFTSGFLILQFYQQQKATQQPFTAAILTENIAPDIRWNESTGNDLVNRLFSLAKKAAEQKPDMAVWTESTVPWTYRSDDNFLGEVLRLTKNQSITHIIGVNSDASASVVYNSAYAIQPDGTVAGRYDKRYLLGLIEEPFAGILFPFLSSGGYEVAPGHSSKPLPTPFGKAGVLICNESTIAKAARDEVHNGAEFLLNMSNDGWFAQTYIAGQHFYNARLRAVETRKDVVVNSNDGVCGLIRSSGEMVSEMQSDEPTVSSVSVQPNSFTTLFTTTPHLFEWAAGLFLLVQIVLIRLKRAE